MGSNPILSATWRIRQEVKPPGFQSGIGGFDSPMRHHLPGWWNRQTQRIQNPPPLAYGFKSHTRHQYWGIAKR